MRQRNTSGQHLDIPSLGLSVEPGEVIDVTGYVPGFTPVKGKADKDAEQVQDEKTEPAEPQEDSK